MFRALWNMFAKKFILIATLAFVTESLVGMGFYLLALIIDSLINEVEN